MSRDRSRRAVDAMAGEPDGGPQVDKTEILAVDGSGDETILTPKGANATLTAVDQILSSASNALMILALAQVASVDQFGTAALMLAVITMCLGFNRGAIGTVLLLLSNAVREDVRAEGGYAVTWAFGTLLIAASAVVVTSAALGEVWLGVAFACVAPVIAMQDTLRLASLAMGNALAAVISDGVWAVLVAALFFVNSTGLWHSTEGTVYAWGAGGAVGLIVLIASTGITPSFQRIFTWWGVYWRSRLRYGFNYSLDQVGAFMMTAIATAVVGAAAAASLRGAFTLFGPLAILITASSLIFVPQARLATDSVAKQWRRMMISSGFMSLLGLATVAALLAIPNPVGRVILGDVWEPAMSVVPFIGISCVAIAWLVSGYNMLAAQGMSAALLRVHALQLVLIVIFSAIGGLVFDTAAGIAVGEAVASWVAVVVVLAVVTRVVRRLSPNDAAAQSKSDQDSTSTEVLT